MSDIKAKAHGITKALGEGWTVGTSPRGSDGAYLNGPDGERVHVVLNGYRTQHKGRLWISASYEEFRKISTRWAPEHGITVTPAKTGDQIAQDIQRRLLPGYRETLAELREQLARWEASEARERAGIARLRAILPDTQVFEYQSAVDFARLGDAVRGDFRVLSNTVEFKIEVSSEYAHEIAELIASIYVRSKKVRKG
ncbi:hypothetical protein [Amycolatopsis pigmentata]|uniref:Uncharacterized protein n=1 Tax=Amycolatopsis pigmentata TaxID=450801 RepID=A0ABW5G6E5_9PSEU